jgi:hypothetical protein
VEREAGDGGELLDARGEYIYREESGWWCEFGKRRGCGGLVMCNRTDGTVWMVLSVVVVMVYREQRGKQKQADNEN